jgi:hypothetical protein
MEYWESTADAGLILFCGLCHPHKKDQIPPNACFQYSNIPIFQYSITPWLGNRSVGFLRPGLKNHVFNGPVSLRLYH